MIALVQVILILLTNSQHANAMKKSALNLGGTGEGFGLIIWGDHDHGSNNIGIWLSGNARLGRSHTISSDFNGAGILDARLSPDDLEQAKEVHRQLCIAVANGPANEVNYMGNFSAYDVDCILNEKLVNHSGSTSDLPKVTFNLLHDYMRKVTESYLDEARNVVKLEARVSDVKRQSNQFLITLEFVNKGDFPIVFPRPDYLTPFQGDQLTVEGVDQDKTINWKINLAGARLANEMDVPVLTSKTATGEDIKDIQVMPRSSTKLAFVVIPDIKIPQGQYTFNVVVFMSASAPDVAPSLGYIDFHSDYRNPAKITFDRDYPSTPEEWKDYESRKAKEISALRPGATIAEDGYYRATGYLGARNAYVQAFKADSTAPALDKDLDVWKWEADLARSTRCEMGQACPREGDWILRSKGAYREPDQTHAQYRRMTRTGDVLPAVTVSGISDTALYWEWLGHTRTNS
jgi:hypothetical protein